MSTPTAPPYQPADRVQARWVTLPNGDRPWYPGTVTACGPSFILGPPWWDLAVTLDDDAANLVLPLDANGNSPDVQRLE